MIRILQVVSIMNAGGMENYIMNLYRRMDRNNIQFDFVVHHMERGLYDDEIEQMGGKIYRFPVLDDKNIVKYCSQLNQFFKLHPEYRIVHGHLSSLAVFYLGIARKKHVPYRITHSHGAGFLHTPKGIAKYILFRAAKWNANIRFACSSEAGHYLFGKEPFEFVPNGIDTSRFHFNPQIREQLRTQLGIENQFVIGHVGRFNLEKNHDFLIRTFCEVRKQRKNVALLLLGDGELLENVREQVLNLGIEDAVIFAGVHKDVEKYYHAMDCFVLPSKFEGLPVTGIEAQYAGLPCFFSDQVTREVEISRNAQFLPIDRKGFEQWVTQLCQVTELPERSAPQIQNNIFDVSKAAVTMANRYQQMWEATEC